jgi:hypothetical protein
MIEKKVDSSFWGYIGKAGVIVGLIWGGIQIFNYFFKAGEYESVAKGNHSFYETSPLHNEAYLKSTEYKALVRTIIEKEGALKDYNLDTLLLKLKGSNNSNEKAYFDMYLHEQGIFAYTNQEYSSIWTFSIKNTGNKPLEELALELPFDGTYKIILPNNVIKSNSFSNKIEIGELRPSYEANVYCWTKNSRTFTEDDEEKSRFTHKNGWFSISYPVEVTGVYAWNKKLNDIPLTIGLGILAFLFMIVYAYGEVTGSKKPKEKIDEEAKETKANESDKNDDSKPDAVK